jgi:hypothetical protein
MLPAGRHLLGPRAGTLRVRTSREGAYAGAGHDLVIEVARWEATLAVGADAATLDLTADSTSLEPRWGLNGPSSLTDNDRESIHRTIDAKILRGMAIRYAGCAALVPGRPVVMEGFLTIGLASRPVTFELRPSSHGRVDALATLLQSDFSIKPYSALLGALKVRDALEIVACARLEAGVAAVHAAA